MLDIMFVFVCAGWAWWEDFSRPEKSRQTSPIAKSQFIPLTHHGGRTITQSQFTENLICSIAIHGKFECSFLALFNKMLNIFCIAKSGIIQIPIDGEYPNYRES